VNESQVTTNRLDGRLTTCVPMFALTSKNRSERIDEVE